MSRLTRDGTAEPVSRDQILRHARGQGNIHFPSSAHHEQDCQPHPVHPYSAICDDHTYVHTYNLHHYLSLRTSRLPSFTYNHNSLHPSPCLPGAFTTQRAYLSPDIGRAYLSPDIGVRGRESIFLLFKRLKHSQYLPRGARHKTYCLYRSTGPKTIVITHRVANPSRLVTSTPKKKIPAACSCSCSCSCSRSRSCSRERDGFHTQPQPPTGRRKLLLAIQHKHSTNSHKTPHTPKPPPYLTHTQLRPP